MDGMGRKALAMLNNVLDAFARMDVDAAFEVHTADKELDKEYEAIARQLMTYMMEDPRSIPKIMDVLWSIRSLERVGDRCQNISEYVIYFVKGKDVRHTSEADIKQNILN
jgi:phosphate transport system protein